MKTPVRLSEITWLAKTRMSSLNDSDEQTSPPAIRGSRGVHVANSHFSKMSANSGNSGCLHDRSLQYTPSPSGPTVPSIVHSITEKFRRGKHARPNEGLCLLLLFSRLRILKPLSSSSLPSFPCSWVIFIL